jgi:hypothetical protein
VQELCEMLEFVLLATGKEVPTDSTFELIKKAD